MKFHLLRLLVLYFFNYSFAKFNDDVSLSDLVPDPLFPDQALRQDYVTLNFNYDDVDETVESDRMFSISKMNRLYKNFLFQGDLVISKEFLKEIVKASSIRGKRQAYRDSNYPKTIWTDEIPYSMHPKMPQKTRRVIRTAIKFWETETCVRFKNAQQRGKNTSHLFFTHQNPGCWSTVGRDVHMKKQVVNVGPGCDQFGVVTHETAHALGIFHEQSRYDRDEFVDIVENRIIDNQKLNFIKIPPQFLSTYDLPYDLGSVMHYAPYEFAKTRKHFTLLPKDLRFMATLGQIDGPSFKDVLLVNKHYKCSDKCKSEISCQNLGYQNPNDCQKCKCPKSFGGRFCEEIEKSSSEICGGTINVTDDLQALMVNFGSMKRVTSRRKCVYHLKANEDRKILLAVKILFGNCIQGCQFNHLLINDRSDLITSGFRLCCSKVEELHFFTYQNFASSEFSTGVHAFQGILVFRSG
ncbi:unnamed protein product, partial [Mesorhabditis belari]|uniref:Zinc metalloproteinase n=1 Tax=Mesorhabditis belari TaxID=2138241 RepID=A0AAF3ELG3_9BILA